MSTNQQTTSINNKQKLFLVFLISILADLTIINLFDEYASEYFHIESFTYSIYMAFILQILLAITIKIEHKIANLFHNKSGLLNTLGRILITWALLFGSKIIMMLVVDMILGDSIEYYGPYHGLGVFVLIIISMLLSEYIIKKVFNALADEGSLN
jgi:hypothetical protein